MPNFNLADYETVEERIEKFWTKHPEGAIRTELASPPADFERCRYRAEVYANYTDALPIATGYAFEIAGSSPVNRTNHEENGETSAIGRALANAGFATKGKRPSREEMDKAQRGESQPSRPQPRDTAPAPTRPVADEWDEDDEPPVATQEQLTDISGLMRGLNMTLPHRQNFARKYIGRELGPGMLAAQAETLILELQKRQDAELQPASA